MVDDALGDGGNLRWRFSEAEDHFGEPLPDGAMCIDAREAQVFERSGAHRHGYLIRRDRRVNRAGPYRFEQFL
jgi:hypothetical protein